MKLDLDGRYRLDPEVMRSIVDGCVLLYDPRDVKVHELNETMSALVEMTDRDLRFEEMVVELGERYGLDDGAAAEAVLAAFDELDRAGLLIKT